jgi:hypothetical protein
MDVAGDEWADYQAEYGKEAGREWAVSEEPRV